MLRISSDPMYLLLREGRIQEFNQKKSAGAAAVLTGCDFRNVDLRGMDAAVNSGEDKGFRVQPVPVNGTAIGQLEAALPQSCDPGPY